jgi:hypothetical protein
VTKGTIQSQKFIRKEKVVEIGFPRVLENVSQNKKIIIEDEALSGIINDLESLDIVLLLQKLGCYVLPPPSIFQNMSGSDIMKSLSKRYLTFNEVRLERRYRRSFGFYGYIVLKLFLNSADPSMSLQPQ